MGIAMAWNSNDGTITVRHETQAFNEQSGSMDIDVHGEITLSAEEWQQLAPKIQDMAASKSGPEDGPRGAVAYGQF